MKADLTNLQTQLGTFRNDLNNYMSSNGSRPGADENHVRQQLRSEYGNIKSNMDNIRSKYGQGKGDRKQNPQMHGQRKRARRRYPGSALESKPLNIFPLINFGKSLREYAFRLR